MIRRCVPRVVSVLAAALLVIGCCPPAQAVTPQEGWYIAGIEEWSGETYYIIDNKPNVSDWYVDFTTTYIQTRTVLGYSSGSFSSAIYGVLSPFEMYQGFSSDSWRIDQDWVIRVGVSYVDTEVLYSPAPTNYTEDSVNLILYDVTKAPILYSSLSDSAGVDYSIDYGESLLIGDWRYSINPTISNSDSGTTLYLPVTDFNYSSGLNVNWNDTTANAALSSARMVDINNLRICIKPTGYWTAVGNAYARAEARLSISYMVPVNKAPDGMAVGDAWPKLRTLEVELQDAYDAYKQTMLQNGQITNPDDINTMFGELGGIQQDGLAALEIGDTEAEFLTSSIGMMQPLFSVLFPIIGVGVILIIFANKGIHG